MRNVNRHRLIRLNQPNRRRANSDPDPEIPFFPEILSILCDRIYYSFRQSVWSVRKVSLSFPGIPRPGLYYWNKVRTRVFARRQNRGEKSDESGGGETAEVDDSREYEPAKKRGGNLCGSRTEFPSEQSELSPRYGVSGFLSGASAGENPRHLRGINIGDWIVDYASANVVLGRPPPRADRGRKTVRRVREKGCPEAAGCARGGCRRTEKFHFSRSRCATLPPPVSVVASSQWNWYNSVSRYFKLKHALNDRFVKLTRNTSLGEFSRISHTRLGKLELLRSLSYIAWRDTKCGV